jgi:hypothetical protein
MFTTLHFSFAFLLFAASTHAAPQAKLPNVFSTKNFKGGPPAEVRGRGVVRVRPVNLSIGLFRKAKAPQKTNMNFFPGTDLIVLWTNVEDVSRPAGLMWKGKIEGDSESYATLLISGKTVTANVTRASGLVYQIRTSADGQYWVREFDPKQLPRESEPLQPTQPPK